MEVWRWGILDSGVEISGLTSRRPAPHFRRLPGKQAATCRDPSSCCMHRQGDPLPLSTPDLQLWSLNFELSCED